MKGKSPNLTNIKVENVRQKLSKRCCKKAETLVSYKYPVERLLIELEDKMLVVSNGHKNLRTYRRKDRVIYRNSFAV